MAITVAGSRRSLTREDWTSAALEALAKEGVRGVVIERLAEAVGATRGSFYWHFRDRRELIVAALDRWESENTTQLRAGLEAVADPIERLRSLFHQVYEQPVDAIEDALATAAEDPLVASSYARVTRLRLEFLRQIFVELGLGDDETDDRAWLAYAFYVGHHRLGQNERIRADRPVALDGVVDVLVAAPGRGGAA